MSATTIQRRARARASRRVGIAIVLAPALLLGGCISFGPKTPDQLIVLSAETSAPAGDLGSGQMDTALIVLDPETDRNLDVLRVPVKVTPATVSYLKDGLWLEKPARQFRKLVAETTRVRTKRLVFEGLASDNGKQVVLSGRLLRMGYDVATSSVLVRYDGLLSAPGKPVMARRFEASVPGVPATAVAVAPAINRAANDVAIQVADWVTSSGL